MRKHRKALLLLVALAAWAPAWAAAPEALESLRQGSEALGREEYGEAEELFAEALRLDPEVKKAVAEAWFRSAGKAFGEGNPERASAILSKAVYFDEGLAPEAGKMLLRGAASVGDEIARERIVSRAVVWAGPQAVLDATREYLEKRLGPPREVPLELAGWVDLAKVQPGDELVILSLHALRQKDGGAIRLMPPAIEAPVRHVFGRDDMGLGNAAQLSLARDRFPTEALVWIIPWSARGAP